MSSTSRRIRRTVIIGAATVAFAGTGVAYAAWTSSGAGAATAKAGSAQAPTTTTVPGSAVTTGLLYPGGPVGNVHVTVNNLNPYPVRVTSVAPAGVITAPGFTCNTSSVTFTAAAPNAPVAAGASATVVLPGAVTMSTAAENGCQGAVFAIPVTVTVVSG